jgi:hypothetical protein
MFHLTNHNCKKSEPENCIFKEIHVLTVADSEHAPLTTLLTARDLVDRSRDVVEAARVFANRPFPRLSHKRVFIHRRDY